MRERRTREQRYRDLLGHLYRRRRSRPVDLEPAPRPSMWRQSGDLWLRPGSNGEMLVVEKSDRSRFELSRRDADLELLERVASFPTMRAAALRANKLATP